MKRRNKVLLTVGTLIGVSGVYGINDSSLINKYVQKGIDINSNVSQSDVDSLLNLQFKIKEIDRPVSTQNLAEYGCGASHHVEGGCGSNHMAEEKYDNLPSEHNPGNRLQEQK